MALKSRRRSFTVLRGVPFTVAVTRVAELGDLTRFDHPSELMNYLGSHPQSTPVASGVAKAPAPSRAIPMPGAAGSKGSGPIATRPT